MDVIKSAANPRVKRLRELAEKASARKKSGTFIIEGIKHCKEAAELAMIGDLYVSETFYNEKLAAEPLFRDFRTTVLGDGLFRETAGTVSPQGVLAIARMPVYDINKILEGEGRRRFLILEDVNDPGNLGTMMRTAEAAGMDMVVMSRGTVDLFNPKTVRATMGAIFRVPYLYAGDLGQTIKDMKEKGVHFYACHLKGTSSFDAVDYAERTAVMIGNEANGLRDATADLADCCVRIPMAGKVESLNAAIAAALMMYQIR